MFAAKSRAAKLSIASVSLLLVIKVVASFLTGSISIRADAVHSFIDLSGVIIGYIGIRISDKPPDEQHAFGHGKAENVAGVIIGSLIFIAAAAIVYEAVRRLIYGGAVELLTTGIYITAAAVVINGVTSWYALKTARSTESVALEATGRDLLADVLSSVAVLVGLILVRFTGLTILDSIVALLVAALIARTAYVTLKRSIGDLVDVKLPEAEENIIRSAIMEHFGELVDFHKLRTRKAGSQRYVDLHLVMPGNVSLNEAHQLCDHLERDIGEKLHDASVIIHVEPCSQECEHCPVTCKPKRKRR